MNSVLRISIVCLLGSYLCTNLYDSEFYWHLLIGRWISAHHSLPHADLWTVLGSGQAWATQHWLFQVLLADVEQYWGETGLAFWKMLTVSAVVGALAWSYSQLSREAFAGMLFATLTACGLLSTIPFEPELAAWIVLPIFLVLLQKLSADPGSKFNWAALILLSIVSANFHPFLPVAAFFGCLSLYDQGTRTGRITAGVLVAVIVAHAVTPNFGYTQFMFQEFWSVMQKNLIEQQHAGTVYHFSVCFLVLMLALSALLWHYNPRALKTGEAAVLVCSALAGLAGTDLTPYSLIYTGALCSTLWGRGEAGKRGNLEQAVAGLRRAAESLPRTGLIWVVLCALFVNCVKLYRAPSTKLAVPAAELDFVLEQDLPQPMFHETPVGGYVAYRFADAAGEAKRKALIVPEIGSSRGVEKLTALKSGWERIFEASAAQTALVSYNSPLFSYLRLDPEWQLVFNRGKPWPAPEFENAALPKSRTWAVFVRKSTHQIQG